MAVSKPRGSRFKERDQPLAGGGRRRKREWLVRFFLLSRSCRFDDRRRTSAIDDSDDSRRSGSSPRRGGHTSFQLRADSARTATIMALAMYTFARFLPTYYYLYVGRYTIFPPSSFFLFILLYKFFFNFERGKVNTR